MKIEAEKKNLGDEEDGNDDLMEEYCDPSEPISADEYDNDDNE